MIPAVSASAGQVGATKQARKPNNFRKLIRNRTVKEFVFCIKALNRRIEEGLPEQVLDQVYHLIETKLFEAEEQGIECSTLLDCYSWTQEHPLVFKR